MNVTISRIESDGKITLQESGGMAIVTIHRPHLKNAMTKNMWRELTEIGRRIRKNPKNSVVILRGGKGQFTAGSDLKQFNNFTIRESKEAFYYMEEAISTFENISLPTIGVINGPAMGAGFELALACDLRIGTPHTKMGMPIGRLGITLNQMFAKRIVDLIGKSRTMDLIYTGRILKANECYELGLINYLLKEDEDVNSYVVNIAKTIKEQSPASLKAAKRSVAYCSPSVNIQWDTGISSSVDPHDFPEGVRAFVEKRKPNFKRG
ncbi:enoyl-CoA hydratase/isomerase family protein [bacterium LRH843]|nr:enoyl-CoA hydratase/isomerase family protein [bacterium LRH843]